MTRATRQLAYLAAQAVESADSALGLAGTDADASIRSESVARRAALTNLATTAADRLRSLVPEMPTVERAPASGVMAAVPRRTYDGPGTALSGSSHPELVALVERMQAQDPTVIFDTLRPICDELWNLIDGERTVGQIAEALVLQFDVDVDPETLVPLFEGLARSGEIEL